MNPLEPPKRLPRKGIRSDKELEAYTDSLRRIVTQMETQTTSMREMGISDIEVDGYNKFDRGFDLVVDFVTNTGAALLKEQIVREKA